MKTAIILFNLGGPDNLDAVKPFLFNLFNDPAIIGVPNPIRWLLAKLISGRRAPVARGIYEQIGGKSPLLDQTQDQAQALEQALGADFKVFIAMRYWHPFAEQALRQAKEWGAERVVLLPLYPQFSTTTTGSSLKQWRNLAGQSFAASETICCYPTEPGLIRAMAQRIREQWQQASDLGKPRVLFSAHGLPQKIIDAGDPYQSQVEQSAAAVVAELNIPDLDWVVCYQSRVGPLKWIGPSTEEELTRAASDKVPVIVNPIAFVSEHSETLVELDIEYRHVAERLGIPGYFRAAAVSSHPEFIEGLARLVRDPAARVGKACVSLCPCPR